MVKIRKGSYYRFNNVWKYKDYNTKNLQTEVHSRYIQSCPKLEANSTLAQNNKRNEYTVLSRMWNHWKTKICQPWGRPASWMHVTKTMKPNLNKWLHSVFFQLCDILEMPTPEYSKKKKKTLVSCGLRTERHEQSTQKF